MIDAIGQNQSLEWITQVDEQDNVVQKIEKFEAHKHPATLHRASSVWLFRMNERGQTEVLLQKRSKEKIVGAGWWANTCCGNVWWEESYEACAQRRLFVELGVELPQQPQLKESYPFTYRAYCNEQYGEYEWVTVFTGKVDAHFQVLPNNTEVEQTQWVSLDELFQKLENAVNMMSTGTYIKPDETTPEKYSDAELQMVTPPLNIVVDGTEMLLAPWTVMMAFDERLRKQLA
jgi:isopentenyl-diphosphate delta-isomerase type 1